MTTMVEHGVGADMRALMAFQAKKKSMGLAYALLVLFGGFGAHRFYCGRIVSGVVLAICTFIGLCVYCAGNATLIIIPGIWWLIDACLIPGWIAKHNARLLAALDGGASATMLVAM